MKKLIDHSIKNYVVGLAVIENNKILIVRRKESDFLGGFYEIPGGKIENSESFEEAASRELFEETGLEITSIIKTLSSFDYASDSGKTRQVNFLVSVKNAAKNKIVLTEHDDYAWIGLSQLNKYNFTTEMYTCIKKILEDEKSA